MSSAAINSSSQSPALPAYVSNVAVAARSLIAALLAVQPQAAKPVAVAKVSSAPVVTRAPSLRQLYRMAGQSDSVNLKLVAQLDYLGSRD